MAKSRPSVQKRNLEARKFDRKEMKALRKARRASEQSDRAALIAAGEDPDLAGIRPGPQPVDEDLEDWTPDI